MSALGGWLAWALLGVGVGGVTPPAPPPPASDLLVVSLEAIHLRDGGDDGGTAEIAWLRSRPGRGSLLAGGSSYRLGDSRWTLGKLGGALQAGQAVLAAEARAGPGRAEGRRFTYQSAKASVTYPLVPGRLWVELEDQYLEIDRAHGNLVAATLTLVPARSLSLAVEHTRSTGGNLSARHLSGRVDLTLGGVRLALGASGGRSRPEPFGLLAAGPEADVEELFAVLTLPLPRGELLLAASRLDHAGFVRTTSTLALRWPLAGAGRRGR